MKMVNAIANIAKHFDKELIIPLQQRFIGRKLLPKNPELSGKGVGMESVDVWTLAALADATIALGLPEEFGDTADVVGDTLNIPILSEPFNIPRRMYESYKLAGIGIDSALSLEAAYRVQLKEEALILDGWAPDGTNYVINGLYQAAGNTEATADDFATYGNAVDKTGLAIAELETDSIYGSYNMVLNPVQKNELSGSYSTTGASEWDQVMKMLNGGEIMSSPTQTAATGMLLATSNKAYGDLVIPQDYKNQVKEDPKLGDLSPLYGMVYEALAPRIKQVNMVCTLTNI
jgi:uncharacterized linocin/CFP29 family protein